MASRLELARDPVTGRFLSRKRKPAKPKRRTTPAGKPAPKRGKRKRTPGQRQESHRPRWRPNPAMPAPQRDVLEIMVDRYKLGGVLYGLGEICHEKAEHLASNWQDTKAAAPWRRMGNRMFREAHEAHERGP